MVSPLRVATRRSALALAQATLIAERLAAATGRPYELVLVTTAGDDTSRAIDSLGTTGVFVTAVRQAVLEGRADLAVHSLKDLPTAPAPGLRIAAVPLREDPRDALCGGALRSLPPGAVLGTGSPRRMAQLRHLRPDLEVRPIRGNVDSRLRYVSDGRAAAVVLAVAGLRRLGRSDAITEVLPVDRCTPAPGQGALAVECRTDLADQLLAEALADLDHAATRAAVTAERALLAALEAGCSAPVGAYAVIDRHELALTGAVADIAGGKVIRMSTTGPTTAPEQLGELLAARLLTAGAANLMGERIP